MKDHLVDSLILTAGPSISDKEVAYVMDAVKYGWNLHHSDYIKRFESSFKLLTGAQHAMATSSCTGAMHLALLALGIQPGDEVIVPEITWIATASAVTYIGAIPVFCDVDPETWTLCPNALETLITKQTKAIMPVHLYGHPCDMEPIQQLAQKHRLKIVEDAAQSIGSEYKGRKTGALGDAAGFSFQGAKMLVTGEGGMLLCEDEDVFKRAQFLNDHGRDPKKTLYNVEIGYKYKMSNLQAALGLAQTERVDELVYQKRQIYDWYYQRLGERDDILLNVEKPWAKNTYWMTSIVLSEKVSVSRDVFMQKLKEKMIDSRPIFYPISSFPMFESCDNPQAYFIGNRGVNLPSGHDRTEEEIDYICHHIKCILDNTTASYALKGWLNYSKQTNLELAKAQDDRSKCDIPILNQGQQIGYLTPITRETLDDADSIQALASWRKTHQHWFPAQFNVTESGTQSWLEHAVLNQPDRILYFVCNQQKKKIGHVGLFRFNYHTKSCELDNIVRGEKDIPGIMFHACRTLIQESVRLYDLKTIYLQVFSDNEKAIALYEKLQFKEIHRIPMKRQQMQDHVSWQPASLNIYEVIERYNVVFCLSELPKLDND